MWKDALEASWCDALFAIERATCSLPRNLAHLSVTVHVSNQIDNGGDARTLFLCGLLLAFVCNGGCSNEWNIFNFLFPLSFRDVLTQAILLGLIQTNTIKHMEKLIIDEWEPGISEPEVEALQCRTLLSSAAGLYVATTQALGTLLTSFNNIHRFVTTSIPADLTTTSTNTKPCQLI